MERPIAWFRVYLAAITGAMSKGEEQPHHICDIARKVADEAMTHLAPGVLDAESEASPAMTPNPETGRTVASSAHADDDDNPTSKSSKRSSSDRKLHAAEGGHVDD